AASRRAYDHGTLSPDITAEQDKLRRADAIVLQFPLWWLGPPAILKGWLDRVLVNGFGFGVTDPGTGRVRRYGDGLLAGKRGLIVTTIGARETSFGPRGIHGRLEDVLFPLNHGCSGTPAWSRYLRWPCTEPIARTRRPCCARGVGCGADWPVWRATGRCRTAASTAATMTPSSCCGRNYGPGVRASTCTTAARTVEKRPRLPL